MESTVFSNLLRSGFEDAVHRYRDLPGRTAEPALASLPIGVLPQRMHDRAVPLPEQDELLAAVMRCYRRYPHSGWSAVLLEMLAPALVQICSRFMSLPPLVDSEDLQQQVIAEVLAVASKMPLREHIRRVQTRVELRVRTAITRWLVEMRRAQAAPLNEAKLSRSASEHLEAIRLELVAPSGDDTGLASLLMLYRSGVLDQALAELALEFGTTPDAVVARQLRAFRRLRKRRPDLFAQASQALHKAA